MGRFAIGFITCVLLLLSHLSYQQPLSNSSDVSVSAVTDSPGFVLNSTTAPQTPIPGVLSPKLPTCNKKFSCQNNCGNGSTKGNELTSDGKVVARCRCDEACLKYHDCCADFSRFCQHLNPPIQGNKNINYTCSKLSTEDNEKGGVFMISTCAVGWKDKEVRLKCLVGSKSANRAFTSANILEDLPVASLLEPEIHYRNIYCGICNNVINKRLLLFWKLKFRCNIRPPTDYNSTQTLDYMLKYCPSRIVQPHQKFKIRSCLPMVSSCSVSIHTEHKKGCLMGASGVIFSKRTTENYKNYHCLYCNGLSMNETKCGPREKLDIFNPKSFEIVMEFQPLVKKQQETKLTSVTSACASDKVYDPHLETCRTGYVPDPLNSIRDKYRVKLWMYPSDDQMRPVSPDQFRNGISSRFSLYPSQIDEVSIATEDNSEAVAFNLYAGAAFRSYDEKKMVDQDTLNVSVLLNFNHSFEIVIANKTWVVLRVTQRQLSCVESEKFPPGEFDLLPTGEASIKKTGESLSPNRFFLVDRDKNGNYSLFVCNSKFTVHCPFVLLPVDSDEYTMFDNKSLLHTTTGRLYTTGEYDLDGRSALVCTNYTKVNYTNSSIQVTVPNFTAKTESVFLRYFTIVGFSVSIFTLTLTLVIHFIFSELRTPLPGKNLMSLCVALSFAQFMWLLGTGDTDKATFCTVVAAVIHYLLLVSFACTAVIAFDTRRTFSSQISKAPGRSIGGQNKNIRFLKYTCLAWGGPLLFVGGCVLLDYFQVVFIGYGNEDACWLVSVNGKIVVLATPIACVLLYNIAAFSHTVWAINSTRKQTTRAKSARQDQGVVLKIYLRLVTLMGFTWFFSFSAELIHKALIYPFVVLTTTQGLYIFVAFICKTRVLKLMKDSFPRSRKDVLASTQQTASTDCRSLPPYTQYRSETDETHM